MLCDDYGSIESDLSPSDCVDLGLAQKNSDRYYDKCCFLRYRRNGIMNLQCLGITRHGFIDVPELIERIEEVFPNMKVYELNCNSSYLKIFALVFALFCLFF